MLSVSCSHPSRSVFSRIVWVMSLLVAISALSATAQPLANRMPVDTVVYVGWSGTDQMPGGYEKSHLKAVLDASNVQMMIDDFLPKIMQKFGQQEQGVREATNLLAVIGPAVWKHPTAIYIGGVDFPENAPPAPRLAIICEAGDKAPAVLDAINAALQQSNMMMAPFPVTVQAVEQTVIFEVSATQVPDLVRGGRAATLPTVPAYLEAMGQVGKNPAVALYVDVEALSKLVDQSMAMAPPQAGENWPKVREGLGLASLKRVAMTMGFDGRDWATTAYLHAPAPRVGLLAQFINAKPLSEGIYAAIPRSSLMAVAMQFDLHGLFRVMREFVGQIAPDKQAAFDLAVAMANKEIGLDVQQDILAPMGSEWAIYAAPEVGGSGLMGLTMVNRLADAPKMGAALGTLKNRFNLEMSKAPDDVKPQIVQYQAGNLLIDYFGVPMVAPGWAISDGNLYAALYPQVLVAAADQVSSKAPTIRDNEQYRAAMKRLGAKDPSAVSFVDLPKLAPEGYQVLLFLSRTFLGWADMVGVQSPPMVVPPLSKIMPHLSPSMTASWTDATGWHYKSLSPFPGAEILGGQSTIGAGYAGLTPLTLGILLPSLGSAREAANRTKSASNLRQIGMGCMVYAADNDGRFPDDLGQLVLQAGLAPNVFIHPKSGKTVPQLDPDQLAAWVKENSDYVYLGAGKNQTQMNAWTVLAHEKPEANRGQGVNVLFGDSHVEWMSMAEFQRHLQASEK